MSSAAAQSPLSVSASFSPNSLRSTLTLDTDLLAPDFHFPSNDAGNGASLIGGGGGGSMLYNNNNNNSSSSSGSLTTGQTIAGSVGVGNSNNNNNNNGPVQSTEFQQLAKTYVRRASNNNNSNNNINRSAGGGVRGRPRDFNGSSSNNDRNTKSRSPQHQEILSTFKNVPSSPSFARQVSRQKSAFFDTKSPQQLDKMYDVKYDSVETRTKSPVNFSRMKGRSELALFNTMKPLEINVNADYSPNKDYVMKRNDPTVALSKTLGREQAMSFVSTPKMISAQNGLDYTKDTSTTTLLYDEKRRPVSPRSYLHTPKFKCMTGRDSQLLYLPPEPKDTQTDLLGSYNPKYDVIDKATKGFDMRKTQERRNKIHAPPAKDLSYMPSYASQNKHTPTPDLFLKEPRKEDVKTLSLSVDSLLSRVSHDLRALGVTAEMEEEAVAEFEAMEAAAAAAAAAAASRTSRSLGHHSGIDDDDEEEQHEYLQSSSMPPQPQQRRRASSSRLNSRSPVMMMAINNSVNNSYNGYNSGRSSAGSPSNSSKSKFITSRSFTPSPPPGSGGGGGGGGLSSSHNYDSSSNSNNNKRAMSTTNI